MEWSASGTIMQMSTTTTAASLHASMSDARCNYFSLLIMDSSSSSLPRKSRTRMWSQTRKIRKTLTQRLDPRRFAFRRPGNEQGSKCISDSTYLLEETQRGLLSGIKSRLDVFWLDGSVTGSSLGSDFPQCSQLLLDVLLLGSVKLSLEFSH